MWLALSGVSGRIRAHDFVVVAMERRDRDKCAAFQFSGRGSTRGPPAAMTHYLSSAVLTFDQHLKCHSLDNSDTGFYLRFSFLELGQEKQCCITRVMGRCFANISDQCFA
jgi:hypothetical protein